MVSKRSSALKLSCQNNKFKLFTRFGRAERQYNECIIFQRPEHINAKKKFMSGLTSHMYYEAYNPQHFTHY